VKKYVLEISAGQNNTAGPKAKRDITKILQTNGFNSLKLELPKSRILKLLFAKNLIRKMTKNFCKDDIFVMQYPMYSRIGTNLLLNESNKRKVKTICVIHDVEAIRLYKNNKTKIRQELDSLGRFDCLVVHNDKMKKWLHEHGLNKPMISLGIFDYLTDQLSPEVSKNLNLVFAGNLGKSKFLEKWKANSKLSLFGIQPSDNYAHSIEYKGVKNPDELPSFLDGSFGIVWDGNSLETNNGIYGEYTKFNNPHKVSLYLSCGLPVIVWEKAAVADFIRENNVGLVIKNLNEIDNVLGKVSEEDYQIMKDNALTLSTKVRHGFFTTNAINKAIKEI
jgi:hypothetical protein